jgi:hypothetical protein
MIYLNRLGLAYTNDFISGKFIERVAENSWCLPVWPLIKDASDRFSAQELIKPVVAIMLDWFFCA